jgi:hypothetical protein
MTGKGCAGIAAVDGWRFAEKREAEAPPPSFTVLEGSFNDCEMLSPKVLLYSIATTAGDKHGAVQNS